MMKRTPSYRKKIVHTTKGKIAYGIVKLGGKVIHLGRWNTKASKQEYKRVIGEWLAGGKQSNEEFVSVTEVAVNYTQEMKKRYRDALGKATEEYKTVKRIMKALREQYGATDALEFKALAFKAMRQKFVDSGLCRYVVNKYCRHIIRAFKLATENEKLPAENYQSMKAVETLKKGRTEAKETDPIKPVEIETINTTLEHLHGILADMVRLQLLTGMRPGELCQLKPEHIDRENDIWVFTPETHKNAHRDQGRAICIGQQAQEILRPYLFRDPSSYCFDPSEAVEQVRRRRNLERVTPKGQGNCRGSSKRKRKPKRQAGNQYNTASYRRAIHRACDAAEIPRWSPNRVRKTAGFIIRKETGSLEAAQACLGHKSRATTERFYAAIDTVIAAETMRKIG